MIGGLLSNTSRLAVVAAAGLFVGGLTMSSAKAADLGGDCCADLEERVAELEATTARKGNRKMSLQVSGQVHRVILWYDDGKSSNAYYGLDNTNASSRFLFTGSAKVTPKVTMGFEFMVEIDSGGTSSKANQFDEDGKLAPFGVAAVTCNAAAVAANPLACPTANTGTSTIAGVGNASANGTLDAYMDARRVAWWVEHADLGRLTVGRWEGSMVFSTIDLTGHIGLGASGSFVNVNGGFYVRGPTGQVYNITWGNVVDPAAASSLRTEVARYDSPVYHGFIFASVIAEAGDFYGSQIRYAGEHAGFRIAGSVGYDRITDVPSPTLIDPLSANFTGRKPDITAWGVALSVQHVPSGLFVQGHYNAADYGGSVIGTATGSTWWGETTSHKKDVAQWLIQAGISKNWFGPGITTTFGEYGKAIDFGADFTCGAASATSASQCTVAGQLGRNYAQPAGASGFTQVFGVTDTETTVWGLGIAQRFDAAATDLYVTYRHFDVDIRCNAGGATCSTPITTGTPAGAAKTLPTEAIDVIVMGARVLF